MSAGRRHRRAIDRAAVKRARLLKAARAGLIKCPARRIDWADSASTKPTGLNSGVIIGIRRSGDRGAVLTFKEFFPEVRSFRCQLLPMGSLFDKVRGNYSSARAPSLSQCPKQNSTYARCVSRLHVDGGGRFNGCLCQGQTLRYRAGTKEIKRVMNTSELAISLEKRRIARD